MNKISTAVFLALALSTSACTTPYGSTGLTGGYFEKRVNDQLLKVNFAGNGFTGADKIQTYALYRCAEIARDAKKSHFVIYESLFAAARDRPAMEPRVGTIGGKPIAIAFMSLEDQARPGAHEVSAVLARLGPQIHVDPNAGSARP